MCCNKLAPNCAIVTYHRVEPIPFAPMRNDLKASLSTTKTRFGEFAVISRIMLKVFGKILVRYMFLNLRHWCFDQLLGSLNVNTGVSQSNTLLCQYFAKPVCCGIDCSTISEKSRSKRRLLNLLFYRSLLW